MVKQKEVGQAENRKATGTQLRDEKSGRFLPGNKSGGRRAMSDEVKEMLLAAAPDAVRLLIETMNNASVQPKIRVRCAEIVLDRVYGKAPQPIEAEMNGGIEIVLAKELLDYAD